MTEPNMGDILVSMEQRMRCLDTISDRMGNRIGPNPQQDIDIVHQLCSDIATLAIQMACAATGGGSSPKIKGLT